MVFKRRKPRTYYEAVTESFYPKGGWRRAARYVWHRLRRLPDPAHKISRGIACGVFVSFTPIFGMHFVLAAGLAALFNGNIMAALLATFFGNPLTFPFIAAVSMETGTWLMGLPPLPLPVVLSAFSDAALELWQNMLAIFTEARPHWDGLETFFHRVFLPYLVGGIAPGLATAIAIYFLSHPILTAYQKARVARLKKKFAKKREKVISRRMEAVEADTLPTPGADRTAAE